MRHLSPRSRPSARSGVGGQIDAEAAPIGEQQQTQGNKPHCMAGSGAKKTPLALRSFCSPPNLTKFREPRRNSRAARLTEPAAAFAEPWWQLAASLPGGLRPATWAQQRHQSTIAAAAGLPGGLLPATWAQQRHQSTIAAAAGLPGGLQPACLVGCNQPRGPSNGPKAPLLLSMTGVSRPHLLRSLLH